MKEMERESIEDASKTSDKIKGNIYTITQVHRVSIDVLAESKEQALRWANIHNVAAKVYNYYDEDWDECISDVRENDGYYAINLTEE